jgi:hypothetical protein
MCNAKQVLYRSHHQRSTGLPEVSNSALTDQQKPADTQLLHNSNAMIWVPDYYSFENLQSAHLQQE